MPTRAVVFDLFGTLIDDLPPTEYSAFLAEIAQRLGADPDRFRDVWRLHDVARQTSPVEECFGAICEELGVSDPARIEAALAFRLEHLRRILVPRPDAEATLRALREQGFRLGMISNASSELVRALGRERIRDAL